MTAIINAELIMRDHFIEDAVLFFEDGIITGYGEMRNTPIPEGCEIIDAKGEYVGPGLVDIHTHTGGDYRLWQHPIPAAQFHLEHGTTTLLPASFPRMTKEEYIQMAANIREAMAAPGGENIAGMYLEGPYINPAYGSNRAANPWNNKPIIPEDYEPMIEACAELARVWGLGPEQENVENFVKAAHKANPNTVFAVTHSEATPQQIEKLIPYGLCIGTHHTNATGTIVNYPECRGVCVDECVNYNDAIYAEIISDSRGIHVDPYMQRLVRKIKGDDKIILVSDRSYQDAPNPPGYDDIHDINFDKWGDIAGSKLTLDVACRNWMKHTGASMVEAFRVASYNPARATGFTDRGEILVGLRADLIITDRKMNVKTVILSGKVMKEN
ncbi:MAG: amidohydrolase family protein [Oscillospiraceae bacterium]|nr:amidohydrolase family protein [Oscillospiraceae bacterium]